jgi:hypothetical protein
MLARGFSPRITFRTRRPFESLRLESPSRLADAPSYGSASITGATPQARDLRKG